MTREVRIGACRLRLTATRDVLAVAERLIRTNPAALLCEEGDCHCYAALQQRLEVPVCPEICGNGLLDAFLAINKIILFRIIQNQRIN